MIRCSICGFSNKDFSEKCIKCHSNLKNNEVLAIQSAPAYDKRTIQVRLDEQEPWDKPREVGPKSFLGNEAAVPAIEENKNNHYGLPKEKEEPANAVVLESSSSRSSGHPTVRRFIPANTRSNYLVAVSFEDEKELRKIALEGDEILLNRELLDPENSSISRNGHANIYCKDGNWYLKNVTALKTTFVQVKQPVRLSDGDVVLIGDSLFKFKQS